MLITTTDEHMLEVGTRIEIEGFYKGQTVGRMVKYVVTYIYDDKEFEAVEV